MADKPNRVLDAEKVIESLDKDISASTEKVQELINQTVDEVLTEQEHQAKLEEEKQQAQAVIVKTKALRDRFVQALEASPLVSAPQSEPAVTPPAEPEPIASIPPVVVEQPQPEPGVPSDDAVPPGPLHEADEASLESGPVPPVVEDDAKTKALQAGEVVVDGIAQPEARKTYVPRVVSKHVKKFKPSSGKAIAIALLAGVVVLILTSRWYDNVLDAAAGDAGWDDNWFVKTLFIWGLPVLATYWAWIQLKLKQSKQS